MPIGRAELIALPAHFLHSEGNFQFYDPVSKILFSGDLGASLIGGEAAKKPVSSLAGHVPRMEGFHRRYMVSNKILRLWARMARQLDIAMIVPQHGAPIMGKEAINDFFEWIENLTRLGPCPSLSHQSIRERFGNHVHAGNQKHIRIHAVGKTVNQDKGKSGCRFFSAQHQFRLGRRPRFGNTDVENGRQKHLCQLLVFKGCTETFFDFGTVLDPAFRFVQACEDSIGQSGQRACFFFDLVLIDPRFKIADFDQNTD